jgi:hypothetical protein
MAIVTQVLAAVAMVVVTPLALRLLDAPGLAALRRIWPYAAAPGAVALFLPRGWPAAALAVTYAALTVALAATALARLASVPGRPARELAAQAAAGPALVAPDAGLPARLRGLTATDLAAGTALVAPLGAGAALVAERAGHELFGFSLGILALTVPHLHYAGLAAVLIAGLAGRAAGSTVAALSVPAGVGLVFAGFFLGRFVELAGAVVLTAGLWLAAWLTWRVVRPRAADRATRVLLAVSSGILVVSMPLALAWAGGRAFDLPHPSVGWMVGTHGVLNAVGFALCALLAWRRLEADPL